MRRKMLCVALVVLILSTFAGSVGAQGPEEERFGIGEADWGGNVNWGAQSSYLANAYDWQPEMGVTQRQVWTGPDVLGTFLFAHNPDTVSEGPSYFGPTWAGPVSNGASDPLVAGQDLFWIASFRGDIAADGPYAAPNAYYTDPGTGHRYNRNMHSLMGPGGHHMHDVNHDDYINCFDIEGFDVNNSIATCDAVNKTGPNDGVYVEQLSTLLDFIDNNPGSTWIIGGEFQLVGSGTAGFSGVDPFMYAVFLRDMEDLIHQHDPAGKVYIKDIGNLAGGLNCDHNYVLCGPANPMPDVHNEPGSDPALDGADWWYTVAEHYNNLNYHPAGHIDGFMADMGISSSDEYTCVDALTGTEMGCATVPSGWVSPFDNSDPSHPTGQWLEYRRRPLAIQHDDARHGGLAWNAFIRYLEHEVRFPLFWLTDGTFHAPIAELFGNAASPVTTGQTWGAAGKTMYWANSAVPFVDRCPPNPFRRYMNVVDDVRAQNEGTAPIPSGDDVTAGYTVCDFRDGQSGVRVFTNTANFDFVIYQGLGQPNRLYVEDADSNGTPDPGGEYALAILPAGDREDAFLAGGLQHQLSLKWMRLFGFDQYNVLYHISRAVHSMPDQGDGNLPGFLNECTGQEYGLVDLDGGGWRTPAGEVLWHVKQTADYVWWGYPGTWQTSGVPNSCFSDEAYQPRPDQSTDNDGGGGTVENGDFPSGW